MPGDRSGPPGWPAGFAPTDTDREAMLVLASLPGLTARRLQVLAAAEGTAAACLAVVRAGRGVGPEDRDLAREIEPRVLGDRLAGIGARMALPGDPDFPDRILDLADPPPALFVRGGTLADLGAMVAIVGARNCSSLGREVASGFGAGLASAGVCVVSGAARGIDGAAHEGALSVGGPTVAVLGSGIDVAYPSRNHRLIERIAAAGAVVSEYPPGVPAQPFRFPARNRIVVALAEAVLVVEGAAGSGSLISADHALDLGRAVFAVPGPVTSPLSEVPLALIRDGAGMVRDARDLLLDMGRLDPAAAVDARSLPGTGTESGAGATGLTAAERRVLEILSGPTLPEAVAGSLGEPLAQVLSTIVMLEVRGLVRTVGGRVEATLGSARIGS